MFELTSDYSKPLGYVVILTNDGQNFNHDPLPVLTFVYPPNPWAERGLYNKTSLALLFECAAPK